MSANILRRICTTCNNVHDERELSQGQVNQVVAQYPEIVRIHESGNTVFIKYGQYETFNCCYRQPQVTH